MQVEIGPEHNQPHLIYHYITAQQPIQQSSQQSVDPPRMCRVVSGSVDEAEEEYCSADP
jgi:hypothetical protein